MQKKILLINRVVLKTIAHTKYKYSKIKKYKNGCLINWRKNMKKQSVTTEEYYGIDVGDEKWVYFENLKCKQSWFLFINLNSRSKSLKVLWKIIGYYYRLFKSAENEDVSTTPHYSLKMDLSAWTINTAIW